MKQKALLFLFILLMPLMARGETLIDGVYYYLNIDTKEATVTDGDNKYIGDITIPETVKHDGETYRVTAIELWAFATCSDLTSISIPNSVTYIGENAFGGCSGLTSITLPNSITTIKENTFRNCSGLTEVTIPNSVTSIGMSAFSGCSGLKSVTIPNSVTEIKVYAFGMCNSLESVYIKDLESWCNISFSDEESNPLFYAHHLFVDGEELTYLIIPDDVTEIGSYAFTGCSGLASVEIPNSVTSIGAAAFYGCSGLTEVKIGNSVTSIKEYAFQECSNLGEIYCYAVNIPYLDGSAFYDEVYLFSTLHVPDVSREAYKESYPWSEFGEVVGEYDKIPIDGIYYNLDIKTKLATVTSGRTEYTGTVTIPETVIHDGYTYRVTAIGDNSFEDCGKLLSVKIPHSITFIGDDAFMDCTGLTEVHISDIAAWCKIISTCEESNPLFYAHHLFLNGKEVTDLEIPYGVTSIGNGAFINCTDLTSVTIPNSVTEIGIEAFSGCSSMKYITIPKSVTEIGAKAFWNCTGLTAVHISDLAAWCKIKFNQWWANPLCYAEHLFMNEKEIYDLAIPDNVTEIGDFAFLNCSNLTSVTIPNSVVNIGANAFESCSSLTSVTIPNSTIGIGMYAFADCSGLKYVTIGISVTEIGLAAFLRCTGLKAIKFPNDVTSIGDYAFYGCSGLRAIGFGDNVTEIGIMAFSSCSSLTDVIIPSNVKEIGSGAFEGCTNLTYIQIYSDALVSKSYSFDSSLKDYFGEQVKEYFLGEQITSIGDCAFANCSDLAYVRIPDSVISIGEWAFYNCTNLTLVVHNGVTSIGKSAFYSCSGLKNIFIPIGVTEIGAQAYAYCNKLTHVYCYAEDVPNTWFNAFEYSNIKDVTLHVPKVSLDTYKATKPWSGFGTIVAISDVVRGDVNGDGEVNVGDLVSVSNFMAGDESISLKDADVNEDGEVNVGDLVTVSNIMAGNE